MDTKPVEPSVWEKYVPTWGQTFASGRHLLTAAASSVGSVTGALVVLHAIGPDQAQMAINYVNQFSHGVTDIVESTAGMIALGTAIYAGWARRPKAMIAAADAVPGVGGVAIEHNATGAAAEAAADPSMPNVKKGVVVPVAAPPPQPTLLGKEAI